MRKRGNNDVICEVKVKELKHRHDLTNTMHYGNSKGFGKEMVKERVIQFFSAIR